MHPLFEYALPWIKWAISIARSYQELIVTLIALYISFGDYILDEPRLIGDIRIN